MHASIDLLVSDLNGERVLRSPDVGWFTLALPRGAVVAPGETAGVLTRLGTSFELRVPTDTHGAIVSDPPDLVRTPVGFGDVLYHLAPLDAANAPKQAQRAGTSSTTASALVLRAPQGGRFYHRPAPGEPTFVTVGAIVKDGQPVGMIEVMKTFSHVTWRATRDLPARARVVALSVPDGADVKAGDVLLELEPE